MMAAANCPAACARKHSWGDFQDAWIALAKLKESPGFNPRPGQTLGLYRCEFCGRWHMGHRRIGETQQREYD